MLKTHGYEIIVHFKLAGIGSLLCGAVTMLAAPRTAIFHHHQGPEGCPPRNSDRMLKQSQATGFGACCYALYRRIVTAAKVSKPPFIMVPSTGKKASIFSWQSTISITKGKSSDKRKSLVV